MIEQYVPANCLSCLFNQDSTVELIPEPFRLQKDVLFKVTCSEFINYINSLPNETVVSLVRELPTMKKLATLRTSETYKVFLESMAFALCKELALAECRRAPATLYLPASFFGSNVMLTQSLSVYKYCRSAEMILRDKVERLGFRIPNKVSTNNEDVLQLATVLYAVSQSTEAVEEVNYVYDK